MNPRILMIVGAVLVLAIIGGVAVYFMAFKQSGPSEAELAAQAANRDSDGDGYKDVDEQAAGTDPNNRDRFPGSHKTVMVAKQDVPANTLLREDMFQSREVTAKGQSPDAAILDANKGSVVDHISQVDIKTGDFIVPAMIFGGKPQLSFLVPKYKRAISLKYVELQAVSGLVQLGDVVDIVGQFRVRRHATAEGGEPTDMDYTRTIVQNARIIALGMQFLPRGAADTSIPPPPSGITLSVYPHEAEELIFAEGQTGARLVLALRSPTNDALARTAGVNDVALFGRGVVNATSGVEVYDGVLAREVTRFRAQDGRRSNLRWSEGGNK